MRPRRLRLITRPALLRIGGLMLFLAIATWWSWFHMIRMPGDSFRGPLPALGAAGTAYRDRLRRDVEKLAGEIGERNVHVRPAALAEAARFIETSFRDAGLATRREEYDAEGVKCANIEAEVPGGASRSEIVVIGGHYDSAIGCPGANDNGTGAAAVLSLAAHFAGAKPGRTLRFVAFVNEEPPFFRTDAMGSRVYAKGCKARGEDIAAMLSLETMGWYSDLPNSQQYPPPFSLFYPSTGNFIGFVGNVASRSLVREAIGTFRASATIPSEGAAVPGFIPGVGFSDQWSFWEEGYPGVMVTDTAPFRYPHYHEPSDTPDKVDYDRLARVVAGLEKVIEAIARVP